MKTPLKIFKNIIKLFLPARLNFSWSLLFEYIICLPLVQLHKDTICHYNRFDSTITILRKKKLFWLFSLYTSYTHATRSIQFWSLLVWFLTTRGDPISVTFFPSNICKKKKTKNPNDCFKFYFSSTVSILTPRILCVPKLLILLACYGRIWLADR